MNNRRAGWILAVALLAVVMMLAACGDDDDSGNSSNDGVVPTTSASDAPATYITLDVNAAYDRLTSDPDAVIVDVRNPEEWQVTGIPVDAALIPLPEFEQRASSELPKDQTIYVICNSGNRSRVASDILINQGYTSVVNVDGGIQAWLREGLPTEAYTP